MRLPTAIRCSTCHQERHAADVLDAFPPESLKYRGKEKCPVVLVLPSTMEYGQCRHRSCLKTENMMNGSGLWEMRSYPASQGIVRRHSGPPDQSPESRYPCSFPKANYQFCKCAQLDHQTTRLPDLHSCVLSTTREMFERADRNFKINDCQV
jgi:hypothetical protein